MQKRVIEFSEILFPSVSTAAAKSYVIILQTERKKLFHQIPLISPQSKPENIASINAYSELQLFELIIFLLLPLLEKLFIVIVNKRL